MRKLIVDQTILMLALVLGFSASPVRAESSEEKEVRAAASRFYEALNQMFTGDLALMKEVWSQKDDVTYMGPGGDFQVGWAKVSAEWERQASMKMGGKLEATDLHVTLGANGGMATVCNYEKGENKNNKGEMRKVSIRATNTFRKENGKWKMVGHHVDLLSNFKD